MSDAAIFGTDGIRGTALEGWLSEPAVEALGRAAATVLGRAQSTDRICLVAHDGRASAAPLERALARGFAAHGFATQSTGLLPTPGLAWLAATREDAAFGAMISASHNPASDNGIKLFARGGAKLSDEDQAEIERILQVEYAAIKAGDASADARLSSHPELTTAYGDHLVSLAAGGGAPLSLEGMHIAIDCANGASSDVGPRVLKALGAQADTLHSAPDGTNINAGCGSTEPGSLQEHVRTSGASVGIALDGDADRCLLVDETGALVDGDAIMTILARDFVERGLWSDRRIVATVMSNRGLHRALAPLDIGVVEVGVGDRQVVEGLRSEGLRLGGEKSGHIIFGGKDASVFIGDGLLTGLHVLGVMARTGRPLSELMAPFRPLSLIHI